ncbi:hypothetical protein A5727_09775 [Mycobacterium sp. ACS4331]|nr:hypothetical protein A5727_09775 [Mycobacterium sp. ACS4331]
MRPAARLWMGDQLDAAAAGAAEELELFSLEEVDDDFSDEEDEDFSLELDDVDPVFLLESRLSVR